MTQMDSPAAWMAGVFHHWSLRKVRAEICARVLDGASGACVILQRPRCFERNSNVTAAKPGSGRWRVDNTLRNLFPYSALRSDRDLIVDCDARNIAVLL